MDLLGAVYRTSVFPLPKFCFGSGRSANFPASQKYSELWSTSPYCRGWESEYEILNHRLRALYVNAYTVFSCTTPRHTAKFVQLSRSFRYSKGCTGRWQSGSNFSFCSTRARRHKDGGRFKTNQRRHPAIFFWQDRISHPAA